MTQNCRKVGVVRSSFVLPVLLFFCINNAYALDIIDVCRTGNLYAHGHFKSEANASQYGYCFGLMEATRLRVYAEQKVLGVCFPQTHMDDNAVAVQDFLNWVTEHEESNEISKLRKHPADMLMVFYQAAYHCNK